MADSTRLLLHAYYETLHRRLSENKDLLLSKIETLLNEEIAKRKAKEKAEAAAGK